ncbi:MAG TPA: hypothetical protein VHV26_14195 [Rhizomicrobium sp.]|jgi:hypothetical protein|nr:hypothetical protein [Rhizomicrobium sp.]
MTCGFGFEVATRLKHVFLLLLLALAGCQTSSGVAVDRIADVRLAGAYIPLRKSVHLGIDHDAGAAVAILPGIAVTCAHNANLIDPALVLGRSARYDLLFFRTPRNLAPKTGAPRRGEAILSYGQSADDPRIRLAHGVVRITDSMPLCTLCGPRSVFGFEGDAGPGFSGGPVIDAADGKLLGIVFSYDDPQKGHRPMIYAYDMALVRAELKALPGPVSKASD